MIYTKTFEAEKVVPDGWQGLSVCLVKQCVPVRQKTVSVLNSRADRRGHFLSKQPRLTTFGHFCRVCPEKWLKGPCLIPADQKLRVWILHEAPYISYTHTYMMIFNHFTPRSYTYRTQTNVSYVYQNMINYLFYNQICS